MTHPSIFGSATALLLCLMSGSANAQPGGTEPLRAGYWETTVQSTNEATGETRNRTGRVCIPRDDTMALTRLMPRQIGTGMSCENRLVKPTAEGTVGWSVTCRGTDGQSLSGPASLRGTGSAVTGEARLEAREKGGKPQRVTQTYRARWLAENCP